MQNLLENCMVIILLICVVIGKYRTGKLSISSVFARCKLLPDFHLLLGSRQEIPCFCAENGI